MQIQLNQLINQILEELKKLGMKKSTIKSYRDSTYSPIRRYCVQQGTTCYEPVILDAFLSSQLKRQENNEISKRHYRRLRRAIIMLQDLFQHDTLQSGRYSAGSKYKPNEYFSLCLKQFLEVQHVSEGTIAHLKTNISQFLTHMECNKHSNFHTFTPKDVTNYLTVAAETHQGSMGNVLYSLRLFLDYLNENSLVQKDFKPVLNRPAQRKKKVLPCFTHEEVEAILKQINLGSKEGKRDYAILFLASHTGLRSSDIANLRLNDLDWVKDTIRIVQQKTNRPLLLPLETNTGNAVAAYILEARPESDSEYIFLRTIAPFRKLSDVTSLGNILKKYRNKAGIIHHPRDGKSFHALRRSMGTWMLESGVPLTTISQVLGHKEQDSAKQYLSMDHKGLAACALDFQGIALERGIFFEGLFQ
jgi:site-specific recombinase XerD